MVRWVKGGTDWCLRCFAASGDLSDHPPCDPPTGLDVLSSKEGITTCTLDYGPDWEPLGLVGPGHRGFTRTELRVRFHGAWRCATCDRSWDASRFGPICACGGEGIPPGSQVPFDRFEETPERPRTHVVPALRPVNRRVSVPQVVARVDGLRRHLRHTPRPERPRRLQWVAGKVADMLADGDLPDVWAAARTLADDAVDLGVDRETAQRIIGRTFVIRGALEVVAA